MSSAFGFVCIALTIGFTVYGQLVLKWQVGLSGALPPGSGEKALHLLRLLLNPWVISGFASAFLASIAWMAAMTKFQLSFAYPFMSLNFVLVIGLGAWLFHEPLSMPRICGLLLIVAGIVVASQG